MRSTCTFHNTVRIDKMHHATNEQETFSGKQVASVLMGSKEEIIPSYFQQEVVTTQDNLDIANSTDESMNLPY